jgi:transposase InsO family protein
VRKRALPTKKAKRVGGVLRASKPNEVWTFDFKGWWKTRDGQRFEPLTVRDAATRFILLCVHCRETFDDVKRYCEELFRRYGLPERIRCDNGPPFAASEAMGGLSRLSAWWVSLGIDVDFSRPATPSDNGAHERMHGDIQEQLSASPADSVDAQQLAVDEWVRLFNHVRPHDSLALETPASVYVRSKKRMKLLQPQYPADAQKLRVSARGRIMLDGHQYFVGTNLAGFHIGLRRRDEEKQVLFFDKLLGTLDSKPQRAR